MEATVPRRFALPAPWLAASVLLFVFRRVVQDHEPIHFREDPPTMPADGDWPEGFEQPMPVAPAVTTT